MKFQTLNALEADHIMKVVTAEHGNLCQSARVLGVDRATLNRKLKALGYTRVTTFVKKTPETAE